MRRPKPKGKTGTTRMKELGYKQLQLWVDKHEHAILQAAAEASGRTLSRWIVRTCLEAANRVRQAARTNADDFAEHEQDE